MVGSGETEVFKLSSWSHPDKQFLCTPKKGTACPKGKRDGTRRVRHFISATTKSTYIACNLIIPSELRKPLNLSSRRDQVLLITKARQYNKEPKMAEPAKNLG